MFLQFVVWYNATVGICKKRFSCYLLFRRGRAGMCRDFATDI
nr:MAG TPA: hypothetical protein [Caudoviricetes sp.]